MSWQVKRSVLNGHSYVDVTFSSYTEDTTMTPGTARDLAKRINKCAEEVDVANRPPLKPFWK